MRYNTYAAIYRVHVSGLPSDSNTPMFTLRGRAAANYNLTTSVIKAGDLKVGWNSVCLTYKHVKCDNNTITFDLFYNTSIQHDITCDGITVVPTHTAIWG